MLLGVTALMGHVVAPALRGGRGLKRGPVYGRPGGQRVAPALRGGRGLKPQELLGVCRAVQLVAPALRGGRGLKLNWLERGTNEAAGGSRPSGRERIETCSGRESGWRRRRGSRPSGRERIETGFQPQFRRLLHGWLPPFGAGED